MYLETLKRKFSALLDVCRGIVAYFRYGSKFIFMCIIFNFTGKLLYYGLFAFMLLKHVDKKLCYEKRMKTIYGIKKKKGKKNGKVCTKRLL